MKSMIIYIRILLTVLMVCLMVSLTLCYSQSSSKGKVVFTRDDSLVVYNFSAWYKKQVLEWDEADKYVPSVIECRKDFFVVQRVAVREDYTCLQELYKVKREEAVRNHFIYGGVGYCAGMMITLLILK